MKGFTKALNLENLIPSIMDTFLSGRRCASDMGGSAKMAKA